jgi:hypothetical protein
MATHRISHLIIVLAMLAAPLLASGPAASEADDPYASELIAKARAARLAQHRQWQTLVHYQPGAFGGTSSLIDSPSFFAAAEGKTNPQAELEATIRSFFKPEALPADRSPQCLRIARYRWLKAELGFDPARLKDQPCPDFEQWFRTLDPESVTLAYPSAYLNNPSSMFGHTLLRIDRPQQREDTRLLSFAINFAADTGPDGGALFAAKGLAGGYRGYFSVMPYYEKVGEYSEIENRDIWEYQLNLKPAEIQMMLQHLWELQGHYVEYYFLSTNCSYVLLSLINTARPDLDLSSGLDLYAIPIDTVRSIVRQDELLGGVVFRPSAMTRMEGLRYGLDAEEQGVALALAGGAVSVDAVRLGDRLPEAQAAILELAQALLQYRLNAGAVNREVAAPRSLQLLRARAAIAQPSAARASVPSIRPDQGHQSARLSGGFGMTGGAPFVEVGLRPALHDLLDPPAGYLPGAEIQILGGRARVYRGELPRLEDFTAVGIQSLSPRDSFFRPMSWRTKLGIERFRENDDDAGWLVGVLEGGAGGTWAVGGGAKLSALVGASLFADRYTPDARIVGVGPELVLSWPVRPWWSTTVEARWQAAAGIDRLSDRYRLNLGQGFHLDANLSLRVEAGVRNDGDDPFAEWMTSLQWYF